MFPRFNLSDRTVSINGLAKPNHKFIVVVVKLFTFYADWQELLQDKDLKEQADFHHIFRKNLAGYNEMVFSEKVDLGEKTWSQVPIEVLFVDAAKSIDIFVNIVNEFFANLIIGGVVIEQDYISAETWWIHLFHGIYQDYFELMESPEGGSVVFRLKKTPRFKLENDFFQELSVDEIVRIFESQIELFPKWHGLCIRLALVNCLVALNHLEMARHHLNLVIHSSLLQPAVAFDLWPSLENLFSRLDEKTNL
jgi:hypothetical protein